MNREVVNFFLSHLHVERRLSPLTIQSYATDLMQFCAFIEPQNIQQSTSASIRSWLIDLSSNQLENRSINRKLAALRTFFKYQQRIGAIQENPMVTIKMVKTKKTLPHYIRESEIQTLIESASEVPTEFNAARDSLCLFLLYGTGIRLAELIQLKKNAVNLTNNTIRVIGKRNKERIIPIPSLLHDMIIQYNQLNPFTHEHLVLTDKGEKLYPMFVQRLVKKNLGEISTLEKLSPHVLRHTYATHLLNRGADLNAIKELLGHANLVATQIYTHNSMEKLKAIYAQAHPKA